MTAVYKPKREHFYLFEGVYTKLVCRLLPALARAGITPNQVTSLNILNAIAVGWFLWQRQFPAAAILIQLYLLLDIVDGNLARFTGQTSRFGQWLDQIADRLFYTLAFLVLGYAVGNSILTLCLYTIAINGYAFTTSRVIAPRLRRLPTIRRWGIKRYFMERKVIFGMDLSTQDIIATLLLLTPWAAAILPLVSALYLADLGYRFLELKRNESILARESSVREIPQPR